MSIVKEVLAQTIPQNVARISDLETVFGNLVSAVLGLAGIVLFIMLLVGGIRYITSGGDPKAAAAARQTLTAAILGLLVITSAFLILRLIGTFTGVDVENFRLIGT